MRNNYANAEKTALSRPALEILPVSRAHVHAPADPTSADHPVAGTGPKAETIHLETPTRRGDVAMAAACLLFGLVGYFLVVPAAVHVPSKFAGTVNSPDFLPKFFLILLSAFSAIYLVKSLVALVKESAQGWAPRTDWTLAGGTALICVAYIAAIFLVGLSLASAICVTATIWYFGERRPAVIAPIAILLPAALWYFFVKIANILFPTPAWGLMEWLESSAATLVLSGGMA